MHSVFYLIKDAERLDHPHHSLDAMLCACRQRAEKLISSRFSL